MNFLKGASAPETFEGRFCYSKPG